jgi:hypothetical protein
MKRTAQVLAVMLLVVAASAVVRAEDITVYASHTGSNNPIDEGFEQNMGNAGNAVTDNGTAAWEINSSRTRYIKDISGIADTLESSMWQMTGTLRCAAIPYDMTQYGIYMEVTYGSGSKAKTYQLIVGSKTELSEVTAACADFGGVTVPVMPNGVFGSGYHTFQLVRDDVTKDSVKFYVDNNFETNITATFGNQPSEGYNRFVWGASGNIGEAGADARWSNVSLTSYAVPEPSSFAILAAGAFGLLAYAWRKRR